MRPFHRFWLILLAVLIPPLAVWSAFHFRSNVTATSNNMAKPAASHATETERMVARLAAIAHTIRPQNGFNNDEKVTQMRVALGQPLRPAQESLLRQQLAQELLISGKTEAAISQYQLAREKLLEVNSAKAHEARHKLLHSLGTAYLRLGEQQNCIAQHNCASCLFPIEPGSLSVHTSTAGSRLALETYTEILKADPNDIAARWLLNVAAMTLGEYPDLVPPEFLIDPKIFATETDFPHFSNIASEVGLRALGISGGVVVEDFDRDGLLDVMVSSMGFTDQLRLFHNDGQGSFTEWTERAGLTGIVGGLNVCHADYDNDGLPDVLVLRGGWLLTSGHPKSLLRNLGHGNFCDVTESAGILSLRPTQTAAWADFDGDGWLDLFIGTESGPENVMPCELYHNNRDGTFTECAQSLGLAIVGMVKGVCWGDYNNDGRPDLYLSRFGEPNLLFRNDGPANSQGSQAPTGKAWWQFSNVSQAAGVSEPEWSFPCWFWDYDNDGWQDLLVFGFASDNSSLAQVASDYLGLPHSGPTPRLYRNRGNETFQDVTSEVGLDTVLLAMGCNYGDLDNDGYLDFYVGTGDPFLNTLVPNRMFRNVGAERFQDVTTAGGFGSLQKGHGVAFADLDNDGDQDIYAVLGGFYAADLAYHVLFENPGFENHWIAFQLEGHTSNRSAIGARVRVDIESTDGPRSIHRTVGTGSCFGSNPLRLHIGLGDASSITRVQIAWPGSKQTQVFSDLPADHVITVREGDEIPTISDAKLFRFSTTRSREISAER